MGSGLGHAAWATRPAHRKGPGALCEARGFGKLSWCVVLPTGAAWQRRPIRMWAWITRGDQACRAISTGQLNASPRLHIRPIDVVVFPGPQGRPGFEVGFPLRCLQRLSRPYVATLHCRWRDNSSTRGTFIPVLSY